ncbi:bolA-like protein 2 [Panthera leo]|uniref:bolA-like protein 2 n=1 Tax=Panthera leo TaxID=9689 RepID=UPI001C69DFC1|nr:bolA-like protein 2 [Panthera leo]
MELSAEYLREKLQRDLEAEHVEVEDTTPNRCASSFRVLVVSAKFEGKPLLQRHRAAPHGDHDPKDAAFVAPGLRLRPSSSLVRTSWGHNLGDTSSLPDHPTFWNRNSGLHLPFPNPIFPPGW